jgi:hypothetical protein
MYVVLLKNPRKLLIIGQPRWLKKTLLFRNFFARCLLSIDVHALETMDIPIPEGGGGFGTYELTG